VPRPVTTPSPGCPPTRPTTWPVSWNEPSSSSTRRRSRAESFPAACWRASRAGPPPARAAARSWSKTEGGDSAPVCGSFAPTPKCCSAATARQRCSPTPRMACARRGVVHRLGTSRLAIVDVINLNAGRRRANPRFKSVPRGTPTTVAQRMFQWVLRVKIIVAPPRLNFDPAAVFLCLAHGI
jgi:hypothetical protein